MAEQKFEDALNKLETIITDLENGSLDLENTVKKYEEGMRLAAFCRKKLLETKKKIEILVKNADGNLTEEPFKEQGLEDRPEGKRHKAEKKRKRPRGEELLF